MDIKYLGHSSFLIKGKQAKVITDPYDPKITGLNFPKSEADIITISHHHHDHDYIDNIIGDPLVIDIPGEYEKKGVRIYGYETYHDEEKGEKRGKNTIFKIEIDQISILHLGDLGHKLSNNLIEEIDVVDILMIPVGGYYTIGPDQAINIISQIEPSIVIPMHYHHSKLKGETFKQIASLDEFLKKAESINSEPINKLSIKKADLTEDTKIVILEI